MTNSAARRQKLQNDNSQTNPSESILFDLDNFESNEDVAKRKRRQKKGKMVCAEINKIRRELIAEGTGGELLKIINKAIRQIRYLSNLTNSQMVEIVLYAVEKSQCATVTEICEETLFGKEDVKKIVAKLKAEDILYEAKRYVPLSDRQYFILKSRRVYVPEADEVFAKAEKSHYSGGE